MQQGTKSNTHGVKQKSILLSYIIKCRISFQLFSDDLLVVISSLLRVSYKEISITLKTIYFNNPFFRK